MLDFASNVGTGIVSAYGQHRANKANKQIAREQMAFQERMSNSSYQRAMDDMRKAGLNPALLFSQGGASSPSGASTSVDNVLGKGVSSALESARLKREFKSVDSQIAVNQALAALYDTNKLEAEQRIARGGADVRTHVGRLINDVLRQPDVYVKRVQRAAGKAGSAVNSAVAESKRLKDEYFARLEEKKTAVNPSGTSKLPQHRSSLSDYVDSSYSKRKRK